MAVTKITDRQAVQSIDLTTEVTGQLPVASGGTGAATLGSGNVVVGAGTSPVTSTKAAPSGAFVGDTDAQILTNKTIDGPSNTVRNVTGTLQPVRLLAETGLTYTISAGTVTQIAGTTIDGVTTAVGDRIAIIGAPASTGAGVATSTQPGNGVYVVTNATTNTTVTRAPDMSGSVVPWALSFTVREGGGNSSYTYYWTNGTGAFTWGTTALVVSGYIRLQDSTIDRPAGVTNVQTLTNKRINPRVNTTASSATPAINTDTTDQFTITALAAAITSMTTNLTGTPVDGQKLMIRIKDNGTARAITWGASFVSSGVATLLATTVISKTHFVGLIYDSAAAKWVCIAVDATGY